MRSEPTPELMFKAGLCIGCGACGAPVALDPFGEYRPTGPARPGFATRCPFSPAAANEDEIAAPLFSKSPKDGRLGRYRDLLVGYAPAFRASGSSGGPVSFVLAKLLETGFVDGVAHVAPAADGRLFAYRVSRSLEAIRQGAQSRYYPVELSGVLDVMRRVPGRYAVVGVPCFIKAVRLAMAAEPVLRARIVATIGLVCGHGKSARLAESFAAQLGISAPDLATLSFRVKDPNRPANWYRARATSRDGRVAEGDWWHFAEGDWGAGFFQNRACDFCDDVMAETADLTLGDAWVAPYTEDGRGTNVVLARADWAVRLLADARASGEAVLTPVSPDLVAETQAAGLRHRREGLSWRLARYRGRVPVKKRVAPTASELPLRRRVIYFMRYLISRQSRVVFAAARTLGQPRLYLLWARPMLRLYQAVAHSRGRLGALCDRWIGPRR